MCPSFRPPSAPPPINVFSPRPRQCPYLQQTLGANRISLEQNDKMSFIHRRSRPARVSVVYRLGILALNLTTCTCMCTNLTTWRTQPLWPEDEIADRHYCDRVRVILAVEYYGNDSFVKSLLFHRSKRDGNTTVATYCINRQNRLSPVRKFTGNFFSNLTGLTRPHDKINALVYFTVHDDLLCYCITWSEF